MRRFRTVLALIAGFLMPISASAQGFEVNSLHIKGMDSRDGRTVFNKAYYDNLYVSFADRSGRNATVKTDEFFYVAVGGIGIMMTDCKVMQGERMIYSSEGSHRIDINCGSGKNNVTGVMETTLVRKGFNWSFRGTATLDGQTYGEKERWQVTESLDIELTSNRCKVKNYRFTRKTPRSNGVTRSVNPKCTIIN